MARISRGRVLGESLCKALGIDSKLVTDINLNISANAIATMTVTCFLDEAQEEQAVRVFTFTGADWQPKDEPEGEADNG